MHLLPPKTLAPVALTNWAKQQFRFDKSPMTNPTAARIAPMNIRQPMKDGASGKSRHAPPDGIGKTAGIEQRNQQQNARCEPDPLPKEEKNCREEDGGRRHFGESGEITQPRVRRVKATE